MAVPEDEWELVGRQAHEVLRAAEEAGVWVFGGEIDESVAPVRVAGDGSVVEGAYPEHEQLSRHRPPSGVRRPGPRRRSIAQRSSVWAVS